MRNQVTTPCPACLKEISFQEEDVTAFIWPAHPMYGSYIYKCEACGTIISNNCSNKILMLMIERGIPCHVMVDPIVDVLDLPKLELDDLIEWHEFIKKIEVEDFMVGYDGNS